MQATTTPDDLKLFRRRKVDYFMIPPVTTTILFLLIPVFALVVYQSQYRGRIPIGVSLWRVDLSGMTLDKAEEALTETFPYQHEKAVVFADPKTGQAWQMSPAELGLEAPYLVGRSGPIYTQLWQLFSSWYYGRPLSPVLVLDEGQLNAALTELAAEINRPTVNAKIEFVGSAIRYTPGQVGRRLDVTDARARLFMPLTRFRQADVELLIQDVIPTIYDPPTVTARVQQMISNEPVTFYIPEPLDAEDLTRFKFNNNTPYYLLIENYYNEIEESLKFYSTGMGRRVEKSGPVFGDIVPAPPQSEDVWQFDSDMESGTVRQIDWATEGATVTVGRTVYNADGQIILQEDFVSNYVPWPGGYMYGPGVNAPDYALVPEND